MKEPLALLADLRRAWPRQTRPLQVGPLQAGPLPTGPLQAGPLQAGPLQAFLLPAALLLASLDAQPVHAQEPRLTHVRDLFVDGSKCRALCYSPDGTTLATGGMLGDILLVDPETGAIRHRLDGGPSKIQHLAFSEDGSCLFSRNQLGEGLQFIAWRVADGERLAATAESVAWPIHSPDGERVAWCDYRSESVHVAEFRNGAFEEVSRLAETGAGPYRALGFSPDNRRLAVASRLRGIVKVYDLATRRVVPTDPDLNWEAGVAWDEQGSLRRVDGNDPDALFRQLDPPRTPTPAPGQSTRRRSGPTCWHPDRQRWCRATQGWCEVYDGQKLTNAFELPHRGRSRSIAQLVGGNGRFAVAQNWSYALRVLDTGTGEEVAERPELPKYVRPIPSPGSPELALLDFSHAAAPRFQRWLLSRDGSLRPTIDISLPGVDPHQGSGSHFVETRHSIAVSRGGRVLGIGSQLVDLDRPEFPPVQLARTATKSLASPDGRSLVSLTGFDEFGVPMDSRAAIHARDGSPRLEVRLTGSPRAATFVDGGRTLLVATTAGLQSFDVETGAGRGDDEAPGAGWVALRTLRDGRVLRVGTLGLELWDHATDRTLAAHGLLKEPWGFSVSDDERLVLVTLEDRLQLFRLER